MLGFSAIADWAFGDAPVSVSTDTGTPVLSSPTAALSGVNDATGSVVSNGHYGILYCFASVQATETNPTKVKQGAQFVEQGSGTQNVTLTGLQYGQAYYLHYIQTSSSGVDSNIVDAGPFTTGTQPTIEFGSSYPSLGNDFAFIAQCPSATGGILLCGWHKPEASVAITDTLLFELWSSSAMIEFVADNWNFSSPNYYYNENTSIYRVTPVVPTVRSSTRASGGTGTEPAGAAQGDLLVVHISGTAGTVTPPAGGFWTKKVDTLANSSAYSVQTYIGIRGATAPSYVFTGSCFEIQVLAITGANPNNPVDVVSTASPNNATSTTPASPTITTKTPNCLILVGLQGVANTATITIPTGFTQDQNNSANGIATAHNTQATAGATGALTWTLSTTDTTATWTMAIRPAIKPSTSTTYVGDYSFYNDPGYTSAQQLGWKFSGLFLYDNGSAWVLRLYTYIPTYGWKTVDQTVSYATIGATPTDLELIVMGSWNGAIPVSMCYWRVYGSIGATPPATSVLDPMRATTLLDTNALADWPLDWTSGAPDLVDRSGFGRNLIANLASLTGVSSNAILIQGSQAPIAPPLVLNQTMSETSSAADAVATGGGSISASISETGSSADAISLSATLGNSINETGSSVDAQSSALTAGLSYTETLIAADTETVAGVTLPSAMSETGSATDTESSGLSAALFVTETGAATDNPTAGMTASLAIVESGSAVDTGSSTLGAAVSLTESGIATDQVSNNMQYVTSLTESGSGADTLSSSYTVLGSVTETGSSTDTQTGLTTINAGVTETGSSSETISTGGSFGVTIAESLAVVDSESLTYTVVAAVTETGSSVDTVSSNLSASLSVAEIGSASDTMGSIRTLVLSTVESGTASDTITAGLSAALSITESGTAIDVQAPSGTFTLTIAEAGTAADSLTAGATMPLAIIEAGSGLDTLSQVSTFATSIAESGSGLDSVSAQMILNTSLTEAVTSLDVVNGTRTISQAITDALSSSDLVTFVSGTIGLSLSESANLTDTIDRNMVVGVVFFDTLVAGELVSGVIVSNIQVSDGYIVKVPYLAWTIVNDTPVWEVLTKKLDYTITVSLKEEIMQLQPKDYQEELPIKFQFATALGSETISSFLVTIEMESGTDAAPTGLLDGAATQVGTDIIQWLKNGIIGNVYRIRCKVVTSGGRILLSSAEVPIIKR